MDRWRHTMLVIVDYGMGNLGSIKNMLKKLGYESIITSDVEMIKIATKLILPGVGAFDYGMSQIRKLDMIDILNHKVLVEKTPVLGICLGMQLMTLGSEEGISNGLGWIKGKACKFISESFKTPHMGWNTIHICKKNCLFDEVEDEKRFYFVHSYYVQCYDKEDILTTTQYATEFVSSFQKNNIYGVQFHPEKSHKFGMHLLKNFMETSC